VTLRLVTDNLGEEDSPEERGLFASRRGTRGGAGPLLHAILEHHLPDLILGLLSLLGS